MKKLKYIIDEFGNFAIFSDKNSHSDMAKGFHFKPVSAGFCTIAVGYKQEKRITPDLILYGEKEITVNVHCFGESISLGLKSKEEDENIINKNI